MNTNETSPPRPGYWFGVIEHGLRQKMREAFTDLDFSRGEWRILHTLADGPKSVAEIEAALPPGERHRRMGARGFGRPGPGFGPWFGPGYGQGFGPWFGRGFGPWSARGFGPASPDERADVHHEHPWHPGDHGHPEHAGDDAHREHAEHHEHASDDVHDEHANHVHPDDDMHHGHAERHEHTSHHDHHADHHDGASRGGGRERRGPRSVAEVLVSFTERGWVVLADGVATLTEAGRGAHDEAQSRVTLLRASVTEGISEADYQTTLATLEKMARNVGWTDAEPEADSADTGDGSDTGDITDTGETGETGEIIEPEAGSES